MANLRQLQSRSLPAYLLLLVMTIGCSGNDGSLILSGTLETDDHDLIAPATARLLVQRMKEGNGVEVGDTVAILDTVAAAAAYRGAQAAVEEARARLNDLKAGSDIEKIRAAKANVDMAQATLAQSERDFLRADSLRDRRLIDTQSLEKAELARDNARSALRVAEEQLADLRRGARVNEVEAALAAVARAQSDRDAARHAYDQLFLLADHVGVIQWLPYQVGEYVPAGRAAATIHNPDSLWVRVYMPEEQLDHVRAGDQVEFRVDSHPDQTYTATVVFVAATSEFTPRNVQTPDERLNLVYAVKLTINPGQDGLRAGMPADFYFD